MSLDALRNRLPDYAKDLRLNLGSLAAEPSLTPQQLAGTFIASALAARNAETTAAITAEFAPRLSPEALNAAKAAAAIMGMNNIYYRFTHLVGGDYPSMPAKLRMNVMARPGVEKVDFELWSLAVSAINLVTVCFFLRDAMARLVLYEKLRQFLWGLRSQPADVSRKVFPILEVWRKIT